MPQCVPLGYIILPRFYILKGSVAICSWVWEAVAASVRPVGNLYLIHLMREGRGYPQRRIPAREFVILVHCNHTEPTHQR